ncbi:MAG: tryptophan 2,3-dioxygenase [Planctomycetes bacterium]|nr:tryptophan 2,3-dioxygenase [Planctomycetota bacterium]
MSDRTPPSYGSYLRLDELLACQAPPDGAESRDLIHHDEMLFIVVHQVFELWFRQMLHDLSRARDILGQPDRPSDERRVDEAQIPRVTELLGRVNEILRLCHDQFTVLETMPSVHFLAFRDALLPASGFQSRQFREFEILTGMRDQDRVRDFGFDYDAMLGDAERVVLDERRSEMSLKAAVFAWLARTPVEVLFPGFPRAFLDAHRDYAATQEQLQARNPRLTEELRAAATARSTQHETALRSYLDPGGDDERRAHAAFLFIASYRQAPLLRWPYTLLEAVIEFEERLRLFRFRHARMVERMIGFRIGTGGSSGVEYLDRTALEYRVFGDLFVGRSFLVNPALLPDLPHPERLEFGFDSGLQRGAPTDGGDR